MRVFGSGTVQDSKVENSAGNELLAVFNDLEHVCFGAWVLPTAAAWASAWLRLPAG